MARVCQVTGRRPKAGNNRSHSMRATKRRFMPNVQKRRFWVPSENRYVHLTVSARGLKRIDIETMAVTPIEFRVNDTRTVYAGGEDVFVRLIDHNRNGDLLSLS